ncbi:MAG TPA: hypothetical protein VIV11_41895 [Kofleriaceae bacterium]
MRSLVMLALLGGTAVAQPRLPPEPDEPAVTPAPAKPQSGLRLAGIVTGAIGLATVGTGIYLGVTASAKADDLTDSPVWNQDLYDDGKIADRNAKILLGVGGAAVIGGVVMYVLGHRAASETGVAVMPARGGATLVWSCEL